MKTPNLYKPEAVASITKNMRVFIDEKWVPCRPMGFQGLCLRKRFGLAWKVLTGRYDAIKWEKQ